MVEIFPFHSFENKFDGTTFHNQMSRMLIARLNISTMLFSEMYIVKCNSMRNYTKL